MGGWWARVEAEVTWGTGWVAVEQVGPGLEGNLMVGV